MFGSNNTREEKKQAFEVKVTRVHALQGGKTAMFDMVVNGVTIYGCALHENEKDGEKRYSITFPSRQDQEDPKKYWKYAYFPMTVENLDDIVNQVSKMV